MKKTILIISTILLLILLFFYLNTPKKIKESSFFQNTIPLLGQQNENILPNPPSIPKNLPKNILTNPNVSTSPSDVNASLAEIDKVQEILPYTLDQFKTTTGVNTTIQIFNLISDPQTTIRIEISGINYGQKDIAGKNAIAFKESFLEAKRYLSSNGVDLKKLQTIFSKYQYAQETALYWVKEFKLLD